MIIIAMLFNLVLPGLRIFFLLSEDFKNFLKNYNSIKDFQFPENLKQLKNTEQI